MSCYAHRVRGTPRPGTTGWMRPLSSHWKHTASRRATHQTKILLRRGFCLGRERKVSSFPSVRSVPANAGRTVECSSANQTPLSETRQLRFLKSYLQGENFPILQHN